MKTAATEEPTATALRPGAPAPQPGASSRAGALVVVIALVVGVGLRVVRLGDVPPGLDQDEACSAYDSYSILKTGRDHHGNFLPLELQAFNDYRMAGFEYSLVPLIGAFGLKTSVVRLGAAIWGSVDMAAVTLTAGLMLGWPAAAIAAALSAPSPWQLPLSRFCHQVIASSAAVSVAMACFFTWLTRRSDRWLLASAALFGLSLYCYAITKAFTPLMIGWLAFLYWSELRRAGAKAIAALGIFVAMAVPQAVLFLRRTTEMQMRFRDISIFGQSGPFLARLENFAAGFASYFTPSYLFFTGDRGDHWTLLHPPGFGQLLPEQALLIALGLAALLGGRRRKPALLLVGWLLLATLPAALTVPLGALRPEANPPGGRPTATIRVFNREALPAPITPSLIFAHPNQRRDALAIAPWILLSALGFAVVVEATAGSALIQTAVAGLILAGVSIHGVRFVRSYFSEYPIVAAPYFQYGMEQVVHSLLTLGNQDNPVIMTDLVNQPYIYILFYGPYPPALFQQGPVQQVPGLWGSVFHFDRYWFADPDYAYARLDHGTFVFRGGDATPSAPAKSIRYPGGETAYNIVVK